MALTESDLDIAVRTYDSPTVAVGLDDLRDLLSERAHLRKQVTELQAAATKTQESARGRRVRAFHLKFGHPVASSPCIPPEDRIRFRVKLVTEEYKEFLLAIFSSEEDESWGVFETVHEAIEDAVEDLEEIRKLAAINVDFVEAMDALEDLDYVVEGTRVEFGVDSEPLAAEVQRANMDKDPNGPDGKPVKPPTWTPPDILGCLRAQGWNPHVRG